MAVTWDLELDHVGVGVDRTEGILVSAFGLTTLSDSTDYRLRVRAVDTTNGVIVYSPWTTWLDFTTQAVPSDVTVDAGHITTTQVLHAATVDIAPSVTIIDTYDLRLTEVGVGSSIITGISESNYALTDLTGGSDYELEARLLRSVDGVIYYSAWSDPVAFTAGAAQPDPIVINAGHITSSQTVHPATVTISEPVNTVVSYDLRLTEVGAGSSVIQGISASDYQLTGLTDAADYELSVRSVNTLDGVIYYSTWSDVVAFTAGAEQPQPVVVNAGHITTSQTLHAATVTLSEPSIEVPATHWVITVIDLSDMSVVFDRMVLTSNAQITGLTEGNNYRVSVVGISATGGVSAPVTVDFSATINTISYYATSTASGAQPLDIFRFTVGHVYNAQTATLTISGISTHVIESMTGTFDGTSLSFAINGTQYEASLFTGTATIAMIMPEELDGRFNIQINENSILRLI